MDQNYKYLFRYIHQVLHVIVFLLIYVEFVILIEMPFLRGSIKHKKFLFSLSSYSIDIRASLLSTGMGIHILYD